MSDNIYPCLWFDGNAKDAARFYFSTFPNSKITSDTPMAVNWELYGQKFMGLNGGPMFTKNPAISFFINCDSEDEINGLWNKLSEAGMVMMALNKYPWSEKYGWCQDKFGVCWQLMLGKMTGKYANAKIVPNFMFTMEKSGKANEAINFYTNLFNKSELRMIARYEKGEHDIEGYIKHAQFTINEKLFTAMDSSGPHPFTFNEGISLVVECKDQTEIDYYWNNFTTDGGTESMCGWCKDKFGVSWQIIPANISAIMMHAEKGAAAMQALLKMKKIVIDKLIV
jgi:predicted 3-demethylubiquinone-9 3-methyltransferase (glyoxalase superfamily)